MKKSRRTKAKDEDVYNVFLTTKEIALVKTLIKHQEFLTTREIAEDAGVHWQTAYKYLKKFRNKGWVSYSKRGKRELWRTHILRLEE